MGSRRFVIGRKRNFLISEHQRHQVAQQLNVSLKCKLGSRHELILLRKDHIY